ncbi:O-antigen ligase family protein [Vibrio sp. JC009]|uniref:O-antigen ligase family protein n=1 Tax=Vibrio sp. JC009 TaxID=2912314 RepID=UPI0023B083CB|nr:O-antigen ligase family protein [Vibrio sp. JC009]WED20610.1 O-antigen ligase family protein [Vibrio sp. JC009]
MTSLGNRAVFLFEKYGFSLVLLYCFKIFSPNLSSKSSIMETDFANMVASESGSNAFKQIFLVLMFLSYLFLAYRHSKNLSYRVLLHNLTPNIYLLVTLVALCFISVFWSAAPLLTVKRILAQSLLIFIISQSLLFSTLHNNNYNNVKILVLSTLILVLISLAMGGGLDTNGELSGYQNSKNVMGSTLAVIFIIFYITGKAKLDTNQILYITLLVVVFLFLIFTRSKTGLALTVLFMLLTCFSNHLLRFFILLFGLVCIVTFLVAPLYSFILADSLQPTDNWNIAKVVGSEFFTDRGLIWGSVYYQLEYFDKMLLGYGYGAFFGTQDIPYFFDVKDSFLRFINSAHNGYIEILSQLGVFGVFLISFIVLGFSMLRNGHLLSAALFILAYNFTESSFLRGVHVIWVMTILILLYDRIDNITRNINES